MSDIAISIEHVSKTYRLGVIGNGTLREDLQSWWARLRGRPDPNSRVDIQHNAIEGQTLWALQDVSLDVKQGEVLGIIGSNGAGKSTLLKILSRVTAPTSGRIKVKGRVASLLEVGTGFHPELTGRENIFLNGAILGMTKAEVARKFDEIVAFSEIGQFIDTPVKRYSSGMYVRLAFAVAAHLEPEILVVDEVLAVGDAAFQKKCLGKMGDVAKEGRTVLFVSHNMGAVRNLCPKSAVLRNGQILSMGDSAEQIQIYMQDLEQKSKVAFTEREDRRGSREAEILQLSVTDAFTHVQNTLCSGHPACFNFRIRRNIPNVKTAVIGFSCFNGTSGEKIFHIDNTQQRKTLSLQDQNEFVCTIPRLPLPIGRYQVDVELRTGANNSIIADYMRSALAFDVVEGDFYNVGTKSPAWGGMVYMDCEWTKPEGLAE